MVFVVIQLFIIYPFSFWVWQSHTRKQLFSRFQKFSCSYRTRLRVKLGQVLPSSSKRPGEHEFLSARGQVRKIVFSDKVYREIFSPKVRFGYSGGYLSFVADFLPLGHLLLKIQRWVNQNSFFPFSKTPMTSLRKGVKRGPPGLVIRGFSEG